jgi:streptogramin lyase
VTELDALISEHPYREHFRAQSMLALYRSGRQADALAAYRDARAAFASGLGIEPGPELRALERAVLDQDPALEAPRVDPNGADARAPASSGRVRRPILGVAFVAFASLAVVAIAALVVLTRGDEPGVVVPPNSVAVIDPATNDLVDTIQVGLRPQPIAAGGGAVWVGNLDERNLTRIDARSRRPAGTIPLDGRSPTGLAFDRGTVWVGHGLLGSVSLVDPQFGEVTHVTPITEKGAYSSTGSVAAGAGAVWVVFGDGTLARLDPATGRVTGRSRTDASPAGVTVGYGSVWVVSAFQSTAQRFNPRSLTEVDSATVLTRPSAIAAGFGDVWVTSAGADLVYRIELGGGSIAATIPVGDGPTAIAVGVGDVWVANTAAGSVDRIDPDRNRVVETIEVGEAPAGLVVAGDLVWVTVQGR